MKKMEIKYSNNKLYIYECIPCMKNTVHRLSKIAPGLRGLEIVLNDDIVDISGLTELRKLEIVWNEDTFRTIDFSIMPKLRMLKLVNISYDINEIAQIPAANFRKLHIVTIMFKFYADKIIAGFTELRNLYLTGSVFIENALNNMTKLRTLHLNVVDYEFGHGHVNPRAFSNLVNLATLSIEGISDEHIPHLPKLTIIDIDGDESYGNSLLKNPQLREVNIYNNHNICNSHLKGLTGLKSLNIDNCNKLNSAVVKNKPKLTHFDYDPSEAMMYDKCDDLFECRNFQHLNLTNCHIRDDVFSNLNKLHTLMIDDCPYITDDVFKLLPNLDYLYIGFCNQIIGKFADLCPKITTLRIYDNDSINTAIIDKMKNLQKLSYLDCPNIDIKKIDTDKIYCSDYDSEYESEYEYE